MSGNVVIRPEQLEKAVMKALSEYGDEATERVGQISKSVARQAAKELKSSAPSGGQYAKGWSHKAVKSGTRQTAEVVYNRTDGQLTHLLEKPHSTGGGTHPVGHYPKHVDYTGTIARIEEEYSTKFMEEVMSKL